MTVGNIPLFLVFYGAAVSVAYGLIGSVMRVAGQKRDRPAVERIGYSLVLGSSCVFLAYVSAVILTIWLYEAGSSAGEALGISILFSSPLVILIPPIIAWILYTQDDIRQHIGRSLGLSFGVLAFVLSAVYTLVFFLS